ncbi:MAG: ThiF family adenylyltransferase [Imperialibacter sp.]|uniref:ThiF family adenylyltransferase n=1 Tax=Imperialibacter sp. TaxID=2038411 RepID=UPI003A83A3E0
MSRYARHLSLKEIGPAGQQKIAEGRVLVIGAGGLGCPVLQYLAAAGVGRIGIVDNDVVSISNLQRQVVFRESDVGKNKAEAAKSHLMALNSTIELVAYQEKITSANALDIVAGFDIVIDCTDNFPTRYLMNDVCLLADKPYIYGAIHRFEGQVAVFNLTKESANYRDLYPTPPAAGSVPTCEQEGVLGVLPGLIGTMQAIEALKIITQSGEVLDSTLVMLGAWDNTRQRMVIKPKGTRAKVTKLIDYEAFCGIKNYQENMKEITVQELDSWKKNGVSFQLIDVREAHEYETVNMGGELMPMSELQEYLDLIDKDRQVVVHCHHGGRSASVIQALQSRYGFDNLYNLIGGIHAWAEEIDPNLPTY